MLQNQKKLKLLVRVGTNYILSKLNGRNKSTFSNKDKQKLQKIIKTLSNPVYSPASSVNLSRYKFPKIDKHLLKEGYIDMRIYRPFLSFTYEPTVFGITNLPTIGEASIRIFCGIQSLFNLDRQISVLIKPILDCEARGYGTLAFASDRKLLIRLLSQKYILMLYLSESVVPNLYSQYPCCRLLDWEMSATRLIKYLFLCSFYDYEHIQRIKNHNIHRTTFLNYFFCKIISIMVPTIFCYLDELFWYFGFGFPDQEPAVRSPQDMYVQIADNLEFMLYEFIESKLGSTT